MSLFARNLKTLRKGQGLTQQNLADQLKINRSSISAYEEGRAEAGYNRLIEIADFFRVSVDELLIVEL